MNPKRGWWIGLISLIVACGLFLAGCAQVEMAGMKGAKPARLASAPEARSDSAAGALVSKKAKRGAPVKEENAVAIAAADAPRTTEPGGLYRWARGADFDVLDGAWLDPVQGTINLYGHRAPPGERNGTPPAVPYLELLAEALEVEAPVFSLEWTPQSEQLVDRALARNFENASVDEITSRMARIFDASGRLNANGVWFFSSVGASVYEGMNRYEVNAAALRATGRANAANALAGIGAWVEGQRAGDPRAAFEGIKSIWANLDIYERCHEIAGQFHRGELSENQAFDLVWPLTLERLTSAFNFPPGKYTGIFWSHRSRGRDANPAMDEAMYVLQQDLNTLPRLALDELSAKLEEVNVPPEMMYQVIGAQPMVRPVFRGLPAHSQLARVAYEADVYAKRLFDQPDLKGVVPGYESYFAFLKRRGERPVASQGHLWIAPGAITVREAADRLSVALGEVRMRFYLERYTAERRSVAEPQLTAFADQLSAHYDAIAARCPALWEVREAVKVLAVADWLKRNGQRPALPMAGRASWSAPATTPGVIYMTMAVQHARTGAILTAAGGVDFRGDQPAARTRGKLVHVGGREMTLDEFRELLDRVYGGKLPAPRPIASIASAEVNARPSRVLSVATGADDRSHVAGEWRATGRGDAASLWDANEVAAAERRYREAVAASSDPKQTAALELMWSRVLHDLGREQEAVAHLRRGAELDPGSELLQIMAAEEFNRTGDLAPCVAALEKAVAINPDNPATARLLADARARLTSSNPMPLGPTAPFRWAAQEAKTAGGSLEADKARDLTDIHVAPLRLSPMSRPDYRALLEQEAYLTRRRAELEATLAAPPVRAEAEAGAPRADEVRKEMEQLKTQIDAVKEKMIRIEVDWEKENGEP